MVSDFVYVIKNEAVLMSRSSAAKEGLRMGAGDVCWDCYARDLGAAVRMFGFGFFKHSLLTGSVKAQGSIMSQLP